jgi:2-methylisocitrate lyase-like PEP mutase family enzyme
MACKTSAASRLRAMLADPDRIIIAPGVYDGISARLALNAGFDALYMTGAGTSMSRIGMADLGLATMTEMKDTAGLIANLDPAVPLIADADTGYGGTLNVGRTVSSYITAGVAAFHLEDQVVNKKCGHLSGKEVVSQEEYVSRIRAAVEMRSKMTSDIVIIARTDALQPLGLDAALSRLRAAVDAGADVAFLEAITQREEVQAVTSVFKGRVPVMYGMVQGSKAYHMTAAEAKAMGIKIMIYAGACLMPTFKSVSQALQVLIKAGDYERSDPEISPHQCFNVCGMQELLDFDQSVSVSVNHKNGDAVGTT